MTTSDKGWSVSYVVRARRRLVYLPSWTASDYWSFCQENGCEWETVLAGLPGAIDAPAILHFAPGVGMPICAAGVEVSFEAGAKIPQGYEHMELPPCELAVFRSAPFKNPDEFGVAIRQVVAAASEFDPSQDGREFAPELAPWMNFGATTELGARVARAVRKLKR